MIPNYFSSARGGDREERLKDALKEMDKGIGLGTLAFGVRCVFYFPKFKTHFKFGFKADYIQPHPYELERLARLWEDSAKFMAEYLQTLRTKQGRRKAVYGAVAVGHYVRFYALENGSDTLKTLGPYERALDFQDDMKEIHMILHYIADGCPNRFADRQWMRYENKFIMATEPSMCGARTDIGGVKSCRCDGFRLDRDLGSEEWNTRYGYCSTCRHMKTFHSRSQQTVIKLTWTLTKDRSTLVQQGISTA